MNEPSQKNGELTAAERATETKWWKSLGELDGNVRGFAEAHLDPASKDELETVDRRSFLELMGASMALAGLGACTAQPEEKIVPASRAPEATIPGKPLYFATSMPMSGAATGLLVESHDGRPTKIEGNALHPSSLGGTDAITQAAILGLYDPNRSQTVKKAGRIDSWDGLLTELRPILESQRSGEGVGLRILSHTICSPTLRRQRDQLLELFPKAEWLEYESVSNEAHIEGLRMTYGREMRPFYDLELAKVIVSFESDFLNRGPGHVAYARQFAQRRKAGRDGDVAEMNRLYAIESTPTVTGANADHRFLLAPKDIERCVEALAYKLGILSGAQATIVEPWDAWLTQVALDLRQNLSSSLVLAGDEQSPRCHALCAAINEGLGNVSKTAFFSEAQDLSDRDRVDYADRPTQAQSLSRLGAQMSSGSIELLLILEGNPVYDAPRSVRFPERLKDVGLTVHLSLYEDETSEACHWHVPAAHFLESWSDARAHNTVASVIQPLIAPLYRGKSSHELVSVLVDEVPRKGYDIVRETWQAKARGRDFETWWNRILHDGVVENSSLPSFTPYMREDFASVMERSQSLDFSQNLDILFRPDPGVFDGRFADNGWLQEVPNPITKLTWGNAALLAPATAERLEVSAGDVVDIESGGETVSLPVWLLPGQAEDCVTLHLGFGRRKAGKVGSGVGVDVQPIRLAETPGRTTGTVQKTGRRSSLACTQEHHSMEGRDLIRTRDVRSAIEPEHESAHGGHGAHGDLSIYPEHPPGEYAWGMIFDLSSCTGCNACVVSCQSENNIPIVGKREVERGREMQWIRIDRYWEGEKDEPRTRFQPIACMHCETAPCEVVCPVGATAHSPEGLNEMVYNRCVGTRYCSNNCPYKVRRFNFFKYSDTESESLKLGRNPDVTVRTRGVMEKCTYCVQRINQARIDAGRDGRKIADGEVVTACQAVCPSEAITFGDLSDPESRVSKLAASPLNYGLLTELNTKPRTTYLARVLNPNPALAHLAPVEAAGEGAHGH